MHNILMTLKPETGCTDMMSLTSNVMTGPCTG